MGDGIDERFIVKVKDLMLKAYLPKPKRRNVIENYGEVLPIIKC